MHAEYTGSYRLHVLQVHFAKIAQPPEPIRKTLPGLPDGGGTHTGARKSAKGSARQDWQSTGKAYEQKNFAVLPLPFFREKEQNGKGLLHSGTVKHRLTFDASGCSTKRSSRKSKLEPRDFMRTASKLQPTGLRTKSG